VTQSCPLFLRKLTGLPPYSQRCKKPGHVYYRRAPAVPPPNTSAFSLHPTSIPVLVVSPSSLWMRPVTTRLPASFFLADGTFQAPKIFSMSPPFDTVDDIALLFSTRFHVSRRSVFFGGFFLLVVPKGGFFFGPPFRYFLYLGFFHSSTFSSLIVSIDTKATMIPPPPFVVVVAGNCGRSAPFPYSFGVLSKPNISSTWRLLAW